ncbi:MAG: flavodoxin family protein [Clostridia bacterium]
MKSKVVYYTKSGNTKKIADAIACEIGCKSEDLNTQINENVEVLFLGASVYKFGIDKKVIEFIDKINPKMVGEVVIFSTSAMSDTGYLKLLKILNAKGFKVSDKHFYCRGKFMLANKNRPNQDDINNARAFARKI